MIKRAFAIGLTLLFFICSEANSQEQSVIFDTISADYSSSSSWEIVRIAISSVLTQNYAIPINIKSDCVIDTIQLVLTVPYQSLIIL